MSSPAAGQGGPRGAFGAPLPRQDGVVKVTGVARYAADHRAEGILSGVLVGASVPAGRLRALDASDARRVPGVTDVLTHEDFPKLGAPPMPPAASSRLPLQDDEIRHDGEPIAVVLADTLESAEYAATLVRADVEPAEFIPHPRGDRAGAAVPRESAYLFFGFSDFVHGEVDGALAGAAVRHEATYVQPSRHHNPMEPSATLAEWHDGGLSLIDATQWVYGIRIVMQAGSSSRLSRSGCAHLTPAAASVARASSGPTRSSPPPRRELWDARCGSSSPALRCTA